MQKHTGFLALAVIVILPACSQSGSYYNHDQNTPSQESGYRVDGNSNHKEREEAKLDAMVDHFFEQADTNQDGYISWKEMMRRHMRSIHEKMEEEKESRRDDDNEMRSNSTDYDNSANGGEMAGDMEESHHNPQE